VGAPSRGHEGFCSTTPGAPGFRRITALVERAQREARDLVFLIGGADGFPADWRPRADLLLSLSAMTFPHESRA